MQLLEEDRHAIFTHPDRTTTSLAQINGRVRHSFDAVTQLDAVVYNRPSRVGTFNGDDTDYEECDDRPFRGGMCLDDEPVFDLSGRLIPAEPGGVELDATNNTSATRNHGFGGSLQMTRAAAVRGRSNQLIAGFSFDGARSRYESATELASLTDDRGTIGSGFTDAASLVGVRTTIASCRVLRVDFYDVSANLTVSGSVRLNRTDVTLRDQIGDDLNGDHEFTRLNPSIGATYALTEKVTAYGSFGMTSRAPTPSELSCADPEDACRLPNAFVADPPLEQVRARTFEGGVRGHARPAAVGRVRVPHGEPRRHHLREQRRADQRRVLPEHRSDDASGARAVRADVARAARAGLGVLHVPERALRRAAHAEQPESSR